jgi:hypothetical protein
MTGSVAVSVNGTSEASQCGAPMKLIDFDTGEDAVS